VLVIILCLLLFSSCEEQYYERSETIQLDQTEIELQRIAENARSTLSSFFRHLANYNRRGGTRAQEHSFFVKYNFAADEYNDIEMEQVWLTGIHFRNGNFYGRLVNSPHHLSGIKKGDTVIITIDLITDWMYIREGKIIGGYSIKYLLEKIPEEQRSEDQRELLKMF